MGLAGPFECPIVNLNRKWRQRITNIIYMIYFELLLPHYFLDVFERGSDQINIVEGVYYRLDVDKREAKVEGKEDLGPQRTILGH